MIWHLFAFGTLWFWLLVLAASILITVATEDNEDNYPASIWLVIACVILYFCGNAEFFNSLGKGIVESPGKAVAIFVGYVFAGTGWSIFKWFFYLHRVKATWLENKKKYPSSYDTFNLKDYQAVEHKERIFHWMIYWPLSGLWTLVNDPFRHAFQWIITHCSGIFNKISASVFKDLPLREDKK